MLSDTSVFTANDMDDTQGFAIGVYGHDMAVMFSGDDKGEI